MGKKLKNTSCRVGKTRPYFLEFTSFCSLFPIPKGTDQNSIGKIVSSSYKLKKYEPSKEILLQKNELCRNLFPVKNPFIHIQIIPNEKTAFHLFEKEKLDWIGEPLSPIPVSYLPTLTHKKKIKPIGGTLFCHFNTLQHPFNCKNFRKALALALNYEKISEQLPLHNMSPASSFVMPNSKLSYRSSFNPTMAKALLKDALKELKQLPKNVILSFETTDLNSSLAKAMQKQWKKILNINICLKPLTFKELLDNLSKKKSIWVYIDGFLKLQIQSIC